MYEKQKNALGSRIPLEGTVFKRTERDKGFFVDVPFP